MGPFLKWAGGKSQLLEKLKARVPKEYEIYYEPFIGGGALLLELRPQRAVIGDINEQLINIYLQLKEAPKNVIDAVKDIEYVTCDKDYYIEVRQSFNDKIIAKELDAETAGMMIWINKHCFNGLYRVNKKGLFNVPYNNNTRANSIDEENLNEIGEYLRTSDISINCADFEMVCANAGKGDFVYFDSPYVPISDTASFTDYTKDGFSLEDHKRLAALFRELDRKGAKVMLSNHDVPLVHELYKGYNIETIDVRRNINSNAQKRTGKEVIVTNYKAAVLEAK